MKEWDLAESLRGLSLPSRHALAFPVVVQCQIPSYCLDGQVTMQTVQWGHLTPSPDQLIDLGTIFLDLCHSLDGVSCMLLCLCSAWELFLGL